MSNVTRAILSSSNTLEELGLRTIVSDLGWEVVEPSTTPPGRDIVAVVSVTSQQLTNAALAATLSSYGSARVVLLVPSMANFFLFLKCPEQVVSILQHDCPLEQLRDTLEFVGQGHTLLPWGAPEHQPCAAPPSESTDADNEWHLTNRELEISREVAFGRSNKEIARRLGIAANTVDVHVSSIRRKLGVHNRTQIAVKIVEKLANAPMNRMMA